MGGDYKNGKRLKSKKKTSSIKSRPDSSTRPSSIISGRSNHELTFSQPNTPSIKSASHFLEPDFSDRNPSSTKSKRFSAKTLLKRAATLGSNKSKVARQIGKINERLAKRFLRIDHQDEVANEGLSPQTTNSTVSSKTSKSKKSFGEWTGSLKRKKEKRTVGNSIIEERSPDPIEDVILSGYKDSTKQRLMTPELAKQLRKHLRPVDQLAKKWNMVYSVSQDGASLKSLYRRCKHFTDEYSLKDYGHLLIIKDTHHCIFGGHFNKPFMFTGNKFDGNGYSFLWKLVDGENAKIELDTESRKPNEPFPYRVKYDSLNVKAFFADENESSTCLYRGGHDCISFGSDNGKLALDVDSSIQKGISFPTKVFNSEQLCNFEKHFEILGLEVWKVGAIPDIPDEYDDDSAASD